MEPAFASRDLSSLREEVPAAGPTDDDPAGGRIEVQPALDADRRRRPASEMVFRAEGKPPGIAADGRADGASDGWAGDAAVALLRVEDSQECLSYRAGGVSADGGEVEGCDDLLGIGDVYDDGGVGRGGNSFSIIEEHDEGAGHLGTVPSSSESGAAMHLEGFDEVVAVEQAIAKVLPKIRRSKSESVCGPGTLIGIFLDQEAVGISEFDSDSDAESVSDLAVVTGGVLGAVAEGALAGKLDGFSVRSK